MHSNTLNWKASVSGDAPITYRVERSTTGPDGAFATIATGVAAVQYVDTDVEAGKRYDYRIYADNPQGESAASNEVSGTIPFLVPSAPLELTVTPA